MTIVKVPERGIEEGNIPTQSCYALYKQSSAMKNRQPGRCTSICYNARKRISLLVYQADFTLKKPFPRNEYGASYSTRAGRKDI